MSSVSGPSIISDDRRFVAAGGVVTRKVADETILVPIARGVGDLDAIYTLTDVGSRIWALLGEPVSLPDLVAAVCREYDVAPDVARQDAAEFLETLAAKKLIDVKEPSWSA